MPDLAKIPRNDFVAAEAYYLARGWLSSGEYTILMQLQDDTDQFEAKTTGWDVRLDLDRPM